MRILTLFPILLCAVASAQNWALLNPAYKYNYSNDGTDTISNQIFVTHIDTLGVDSFRYELNRIGVVCDTCPATMACDTCGYDYLESCDGCFMWVNQPQFLGFDCIHFGNSWLFQAQDTFLLQASEGAGTSWTFNANEGTTALVDAEWPDIILGMPDTLRRILLSNGDTLLLSRSFGIVRFSSGQVRYELIGVEGAEVGRLFPDPLAYFDYQPGDVLTYKIYCNYWCSPPGGPAFPQMFFHYRNISITGRSESEDTLMYSTSTARTFPDPWPDCSLTDCPDWPMPISQWSFNQTDILNDHPILAAYPAEVLDISICWTEWYPGFPGYLAGHGISDEGRTVMRSRLIGNYYYLDVPTSGFAMNPEIIPGLLRFDETSLLDVWYEEGIGLRKVEYVREPGYRGMSVELVGAVIGGDTIIQPPAIEWAVGMPEERSSSLLVSPNPASDAIFLKDVEQGIVRVLDLEGRILRSIRTSAENMQVEVSDLASGTYLLSLTTPEGQVSTRFSVLH